MILGYNNLDGFVYDCFVKKDKSKTKSPIWWLKGKEIVVQGADVYDEIRDVAFGDLPEELLILARVHGFDIAKSQEL